MVGVTPHLIHRLWFGPRPMPGLYQDFGARWAELNPGWVVHDWGYDDLPLLRNQYLFDRCGDTWGGISGAGKQGSAKQVQQADIAAYELVEQFGGVYVNCDLEPLKPLEPLLDEVGVKAFACVSPDAGFLSNAVLGGPAGHWFWGAVIDFLPVSVASKPIRAMNKQTGPALLTEVAERERVWWASGVVDGSETYRRWGEFAALPAAYFNPYGYQEMGREGGVFPDAYAEHHWGHRYLDEVLWPGEPEQVGEAPKWIRDALRQVGDKGLGPRFGSRIS